MVPFPLGLHAIAIKGHAMSGISLNKIYKS